MQHRLELGFSSPQDVFEAPSGFKKAVDKSSKNWSQEAIKHCACYFPFRKWVAMSSQDLGECNSKRSLCSCFVWLILSLQVFHCSVLERGSCSGKSWLEKLWSQKSLPYLWWSLFFILVGNGRLHFHVLIHLLNLDFPSPYKWIFSLE